MQNNGGDDLTLTAKGTFTFSTALLNGSSYSVTVHTQPSGQTCTVTNGLGAVSGSNVTNVAVSCAETTHYTIGGTLNGLNNSETVVLQNNGGDDLTLTAKGTFTFSTALLNGSSYSVTVHTQPSGQTCTVSNDSGTVLGSNVTIVNVSCQGSIAWILGSNFETCSYSNDSFSSCQPASISSSTTSITEVSDVVFNSASTMAYLTLSPGQSGVEDYTYSCAVTSNTNLSCTVANQGFCNQPASVVLNRANTYAYFACFGGSNVQICQVGGDGLLENCTDSGAGTVAQEPNSMTLNAIGDTAFIISSGLVTKCTIETNATPPTFSSCVDACADSTCITYLHTNLFDPQSIVISSNNVAFILNLESPSAIFQCTLTDQNTLTNCGNTMVPLDQLHKPTNMAFSPSGQYLFITNGTSFQGNFQAVTQCTVSGSSLKNCTNSGADPSHYLEYPSAIAFAAPFN